MTPPIFNPVKELIIAGETLLVKELSWPDALAFFNKLRDQAKGLVNEKGELALDAAKIMDAIADNVQLASWLVSKTSGKDAAWIEQRSLSEMLDVVSAALEVNLGVIAGRLKNVRGRLAALAAGEATGKSSPTSPPSAT